MATKILAKSLNKLKKAAGLSTQSQSKSNAAPEEILPELRTEEEEQLTPLKVLNKKDAPGWTRKKASPLKVEKEVVRDSSDMMNPGGIAFRAWEIWMEKGCPADCDLEHWLEAEAEQQRN